MNEVAVARTRCLALMSYRISEYATSGESAARMEAEHELAVDALIKAVQDKELRRVWVVEDCGCLMPRYVELEPEWCALHTP